MVQEALERADVAASIGDGAPGPAGPTLDVTLGELCGLLAVTGLALVGTASVALAEVGWHDGWLALASGLAATALAGVVMWWSGPRPRVRVDTAEVALVAATAAVAAFLFLPGFPYVSADKDPGVYVAHAFAIAREGDVSIPDPVLEHDLPTDLYNRSRFPGVWLDPDDPDVVTPQFFHLYPATLATAHDLVGRQGVLHLTPALAVLSVCVLTIAARRATSTLTAVVFAALLVTSMMQVWQAKYPSTEVVAQCLLAGTLLAGVLAVDRRWSGAAFAAGVLLGVGFLARPDGFLYLLLAAAVAGTAIARGRVDRRLALLALGLATTFPYGAVNAYALRTRYSAGNSVPSLPLLTAACAALVLAGVAVRWIRAVAARRRSVGEGGADRVGGSATWRRLVGPAAVAGAGALLLVLWNRETLFGTHHVFSHHVGRTVPSLDEANIHWLSWFVTTPGLVLMWLGIAVAALTRCRPALYLLVLPGAALLPVYLWDARISMRMMWWVRRFVPAVLPAVLLLIALALGWALARRNLVARVAGALAAAALVVAFAAQSLPLRGHGEMAGSWEAAEAVARLAGDEQGVFLYTWPSDVLDPRRNTPAVEWFVFDQVASRLPAGAGITDVEAYQAAFPDQPVFVVTDGELPAGLPPGRFRRAGAVTEQLTMWEEAVDRRPDGQVVVRRPLVAWRLDG